MNSEELLPRLIRACLDSDRRLVEEISMMYVKILKKKNPLLAQEIANSLTYARNGASAIRAADVQPVPVDRESRFSLCKAEEPLETEFPILDQTTSDELNCFIYERSQIETLLLEDITPPNSLLFTGAPGVGKTYTARWLSYQLGLPLITMDLATSISSYLGRTGQNIKSLFDYARSFPSILFLDEIDAIAKRRDDASDLGELKRLVNVLLKELETWPSYSVIIAATNHPDLLDKAIWRRFDRVVEFNLPDLDEREKIIERYLGKYYDKLSESAISYAVKQTEQVNTADICKLCMHAKRRMVLEKSNPDFIILEEFFSGKLDTKDGKREVCNLLKETNPSLSIRDISKITKISASSVSRYLQKEE